MADSLEALVRFMGRHPAVDDVDELLDMFQADAGFGDARRRELKKAYHAKCGKILRDPKYVRAIESGQRQVRRVKQKKRQQRGSVLSKPARAQRAARKAIQPALLSAPGTHTFQETIHAALQPVDVAEEIDNAIEEQEESGSGSEQDQQQDSDSEEGQGLGGDGDEDEEQQQGARGLPISLSPISPVSSSGARTTPRRRGGGGGSSERELSMMGSSSRSAEDLREYERALARIRYVAHIEPWRDEQAVVNAAEQMKEFGVLIPTDSLRHQLTWPQIDLVIRVGKRRRMAMARRVRSTSSTTRSGARGMGAASVSSTPVPAPSLDSVADRAEWIASRMSQMIPAEVLVEFGEEERELVSKVIRGVDRARAGAGLDFAAGLRLEGVPDHGALERLEDVGEIGDDGMRRAVNKEAVHIIEAQESLELRKRQACYNALAMSKAIDTIMRVHITGMLLSGLCEAESPNVPLIQRIAAMHKQTSTRLLGAVDYLNQGVR
jgi:hypothetical protein